jgi:hypothetical protein
MDSNDPIFLPRGAGASKRVPGDDRGCDIVTALLRAVVQAASPLPKEIQWH